MKRYLQAVSIFGGESDWCLDEGEVYLAIIHDGSGYTPAACISWGPNKHKALETAYELLESILEEEQTVEERNERWATMEKEGYDPLTGSFDGGVFKTTGREILDFIVELDEGRLKKRLEEIFNENL
jgi:hypothetical protein